MVVVILECQDEDCKTKGHYFKDIDGHISWITKTTDDPDHVHDFVIPEEMT